MSELSSNTKFNEAHKKLKQTNKTTHKRLRMTKERFDVADSLRYNRSLEIKAEATVIKAQTLRDADITTHDSKCAEAEAEVLRLAEQTAVALRKYRLLVPPKTGCGLLFATGRIGVDPLLCNVGDASSNIGFKAMTVLFHASFCDESLLQKGQRTNKGIDEPTSGQDGRLLSPKYKIYPSSVVNVAATVVGTVVPANVSISTSSNSSGNSSHSSSSSSSNSST
jgi:hypothetical protein